MTVVIVLGLLAMGFLPPIKIGDHILRKVDLLADIRTDTTTNSLPEIDIPDLEDLINEDLEKEKDSISSASDSLIIPTQDSIPVEPTPEHSKIIGDDSWQSVDTNEEGVTYIVDYSKGTKHGISTFYRALTGLKEEDNAVRIAFFGDSFIEGDILTSDLRSLLQSEYGGSGVGFVSITSQTNGFRPTVVHSFGGWNSYSATDKSGYKTSNLGIAGHYFTTNQSAYVELRGQKKYGAHLDTCAVSTIYFKNRDQIQLTAKVNNEEPVSFDIPQTEELQAIEVKGSIGKIRWNAKADSTDLFYGVAMDGDRGISLDNFSLRGSAGHYINTVPKKNMIEFNKLRPYNLIVLQYGLNVLSTEVYDYNYYRLVMKKVITYLKEVFPNSGILLVSVGDRDYKNTEGKYTTMPELKYFLDIQRQIAKENNIAFWNMFEAMGGLNSMKSYVDSSPAKANLDYTHINFRGGKAIAKKLMESLTQGVKDFENSEIYEGE